VKINKPLLNKTKDKAVNKDRRKKSEYTRMEKRLEISRK